MTQISVITALLHGMSPNPPRAALVTKDTALLLLLLPQSEGIRRAQGTQTHTGRGLGKPRHFIFGVENQPLPSQGVPQVLDPTNIEFWRGLCRVLPEDILGAQGKAIPAHKGTDYPENSRQEVMELQGAHSSCHGSSGLGTEEGTQVCSDG